ncbi:aquaporin [Apiospora marii]|uniref:aquaporin n=1 Tax=Apiospora marii TaxID=335849 RepID=UPI003130A719
MNRHVGLLRRRIDDALAPAPRPLVSRCPKKLKNHLVAMLSEFVGTFMFLFFAFGGTNAVNTAPTSGEPLNANPAKLLYISLCFGMSLMINAWVFFRISGGLFNPAVTLGMMLVGALDYLRGGLIIVSQILGGIAASAVIYGLLPGPLNIRTTLGGGTSVVQGLFIEMFLTAELVFAIFMLAAEKHKATFIAPVGIGISLFIAELLGVYYTGGSLNPARSFGPCVVLASFSNYHWIYWVGPILGSLLASGFYLLVKALEYETVNPDQDTS